MAKRKRPTKATKDDSTGKTPEINETAVDSVESAKADTWTADDYDALPETPSLEANEEIVETDLPETEAVETAAPEAETAEEVAPEVTAETSDEPEPEPEPEPESNIVAPAIQTQEPRSALPLVFGGVVAAALGFIAAQADMFSRGSDGMAEAEALRSELSAALDRVDTLEETLANLPEPQPLPEPEPVDFSPLEEQIAALQDRVEILATTPAEDGTLPAAAFAATLADMRAETENTLTDVRAATETQQAEIDSLLAEVANAKADAQAAANAALARAAVSQITTALDSGAPFDDAIQSLQAADQPDIPDALASVAGTGVAPLSQLQGSIANAARDALDAARAADDTGSVGAFFERRFGGRSIVPREGSDPDAVLSRVEAAVRAGDLETALSESTALPEESQSALGSWLEQAQQRHEAVKAADALAQRLSAL
ncbi:MAG: hypothetical protein ABJ263_08620 [Tateyamaria sp.]|uniref:COG4223 family protein n=1 Tax=Tateyamaria sp. TaxID=1929288 RepID=UPI003287D3FF